MEEIKLTQEDVVAFVEVLTSKDTDKQPTDKFIKAVKQYNTTVEV